MDALAMGNYGPYVWSCFALAFVIVVYTDWRSRVQHRRVYRDIEVQIKALEDRR
jgi:heme exporter protein CcmD